MTNQITERDWEALSAYLDGQLNESERARLEARLRSNNAYQEALEQMRQTRAVLRSQPRLRAPRNFTLTAEMAGIKRDVRPSSSRLFSYFGLASAFASVLLVLVFMGEFFLASRATQVASLPASSQVLEAAPSMESPAEEQGPAFAVEAPPEIQSVPQGEGTPLAYERAMSAAEAYPAPESTQLSEKAAPSQDAPMGVMPSGGGGYPAPSEEPAGAAAMMMAGTPTPGPADSSMAAGIAENPNLGAATESGTTEAYMPQIENSTEGGEAVQEQEAQPLAAMEATAQNDQSQPPFWNIWRIAELALALLAVGTGLIAVFLRRKTS